MDVITVRVSAPVDTHDNPDSARILQALAVRIMWLGCYPWFSFVYSEDNISDGPSRGEFGLLLSLGAKRRKLVRPTLATLGSLDTENFAIPGWTA